jgi:hypothetical protein
MYWKGLGRKRLWCNCHILASALRDRRKPWKISVRKASVPAVIQTKHLWNAGLEWYLYTTLYCETECSMRENLVSGNVN